MDGTGDQPAAEYASAPGHLAHQPDTDDAVFGSCRWARPVSSSRRRAAERDAVRTVHGGDSFTWRERRPGPSARRQGGVRTTVQAVQDIAQLTARERRLLVAEGRATGRSQKWLTSEATVNAHPADHRETRRAEPRASPYSALAGLLVERSVTKAALPETSVYRRLDWEDGTVAMLHDERLGPEPLT